VQQVEPAAGLADVLDDEVGGRVGVEPVAVLEGVESNQTSSTSSIRRIVDRPVGSSGLGRVSSSMTGRCRSSSRTPKSRSSSSSEPYTSTRGWFGSSLFHTGIGLPQYRLRLIDQSRALASHLPNWPSLTFSGTQLICWFSSIIRSRISGTRTNQLDTAL
jgi:hypothetical protein